MNATPRASTSEPGSGNGNNIKGTGVAMCHMRRLLPRGSRLIGFAVESFNGRVTLATV